MFWEIILFFAHYLINNCTFAKIIYNMSEDINRIKVVLAKKRKPIDGFLCKDEDVKDLQWRT